MGHAPAFGDSRSTPLRVRFGLYEVDLYKRELRKGTLRLKVPHQSFQILAMLSWNGRDRLSRAKT